MASQLITRERRGKLAARPKPYWEELDLRGRALGYRKGSRKASWVVREFDKVQNRYTERVLGTADDDAPDDGDKILSYAQAREKANRTNAKAIPMVRGLDGTVAEAVDVYFKAREERDAKRGRGAENEYARVADREKLGRAVQPEFFERQVSQISTDELNAWMLGQVDKRVAKADKDAPRDEVHRKARATVHRIWSIFRAVLNHYAKAARRKGITISSDAWTAVEPLQDFDHADTHALTPAQVKRLIDACEPDFALIVRAGYETGCRWSELTRLRVSDFDGHAVHIRYGKSVNARRDVVLSTAGRAFFKSAVKGKAPTDHIFVQADGRSWEAPPAEKGKKVRQSQWQTKRMRAACAAAKLPPTKFRDIRRTNATVQINAGGDINIISAQHGHAGVAITKKHYAHLLRKTKRVHADKALAPIAATRRKPKRNK